MHLSNTKKLLLLFPLGIIVGILLIPCLSFVLVKCNLAGSSYKGGGIILAIVLPIGTVIATVWITGWIGLVTSIYFLVKKKLPQKRNYLFLLFYSLISLPPCLLFLLPEWGIIFLLILFNISKRFFIGE